MDRRGVAGSGWRHARSGSGLGRGGALAAGLTLLAAVVASAPAPAYAASRPVVADTAYASRPATAPGIRASEQYVFSMGVVDAVGADRLTLRFADGATETYRLNGATTVQTRNGDALRPADLAVGELVIVLTVENDPLAVTIVSGGRDGFHAAGPADIRGHEEPECAACDAHAP